MNNKVSESPGNSCNLEYPKNDTFELYTKKLISLSQMINQTISTHRMTYDKQRDKHRRKVIIKFMIN